MCVCACVCVWALHFIFDTHHPMDGYPLPPSSLPTHRKAQLHVGSAICRELLGKLLCDMGAMREESLATSYSHTGGGGCSSSGYNSYSSYSSYSAGGEQGARTSRHGGWGWDRLGMG